MLRFVTGNDGKLREARSYLNEPIEQATYDYTEIQAADIEPIAVSGAREAYQELQVPLFVDDSGLFIDQLNGFPGPYSSFVESTIGIEQVAELAADKPAPDAHFRSVIAFASAGLDPAVETESTTYHPGDPPVLTVEGRVDGTIVPPRGEGGFGFDPIFEVDGQTFAEMTPTAKNEISHRGEALARFAHWRDQV